MERPPIGGARARVSQLRRPTARLATPHGGSRCLSNAQWYGGARYGRWNGQRAGLFFETWLPDGSATLHVLYDARARRVMARASVEGDAADALVAQTGEGGRTLHSWRSTRASWP